MPVNHISSLKKEGEIFVLACAMNNFAKTVHVSVCHKSSKKNEETQRIKMKKRDDF